MSDEVEKEELPEIDEDIVAGDVVARDEEKPLEASPAGSVAADLGLILEVPLRLSVELGSASLPVRDVLALSKGSIVELDRMSGEPADIYVNDRLIARGELAVQDDRVAVRITELLAVQSSAEAG